MGNWLSILELAVSITSPLQRTYEIFRKYLRKIVGLPVADGRAYDRMKAKDVIEAVNDRLQSEGFFKPQHILSNSKLNDFRRHLAPAPRLYPGKSYYNFSSRHIEILFLALRKMAQDRTKTSAAFSLAIADVDNNQQTVLGI